MKSILLVTFTALLIQLVLSQKPFIGLTVEVDSGQDENEDPEDKTVRNDEADDGGEDESSARFRMAGQLCFEEHNAIRRQYGKPTFNFDSRLAMASDSHNSYMTSRDCFSHQCNGEVPFGERIRRAGYKWSGAAENIAAGSDSCQGVMKQWMNSNSGHREKILGNYKDIGCAMKYCGECQWKYYWTCTFANPAAYSHLTYNLHIATFQLFNQLVL